MNGIANTDIKKACGGINHINNMEEAIAIVKLANQDQLQRILEILKL